MREAGTLREIVNPEMKSSMSSVRQSHLFELIQYECEITGTVTPTNHAVGNSMRVFFAYLITTQNASMNQSSCLAESLMLQGQGDPQILFSV